MSATKQSDKLKEGDEVALRLKVAKIYPDGSPDFVESSTGHRFIVGTDTIASMHKVRPGTYEVTTRELVKMVARLFRYKRLVSLVIQSKGCLNGLLQRRLRHFFKARLKELKRKRKS